jgi:hypothetical protein
VNGTAGTIPPVGISGTPRGLTADMATKIVATS